jgi:hypothetical protein
MDSQDAMLHQTTEIEGNLPCGYTEWDYGLFIEDTNRIELIGTDEQRTEMFKDWALYFSEVTNPDNTTMNTFFKAKYAPLNEVLNTVRPVMGKYGLSIIQTPYVKDGDPCVKTIVIHKGGAMIAFPTASGKATKGDIQGFGSTVSYLRRFAVNAIAGVMGEVDDDGNSNAQNAGKKEPSKEDVVLKELQEKILKAATDQIEKGVDKDAVYNIISENNNGKKNPNAIKDIDVAKKVLVEINNLKNEENK